MRLFLPAAFLLLTFVHADDSRGTWSKGAEMPTQRSELASATVDGKVYVVGGISHRGSLRSFEAYDMANARWEKLPSLPTKLNHVGTAYCDGKIYVSGGYRDMYRKKWSDSLYAYDLRSREWSEVSKLPEARVKHFMVERDGWLHLFGGLKTTEVWSWHVRSGKWSRNRIAPMPELRDHISVVQDTRNIYVVGGRKGKVPQADCWRHDFRTGKWDTFAQLPEATGGHTAVLVGGKIHVLGGEDQRTKEVFSRYDIYDLSTGRWEMGPSLPTGRHGLVSGCFQGNLCVIGGGKKSHIGTIVSTSRMVDVLPVN
ncbi:MAG: hypothetical protein CMO55_12865 [Verrucomicrobiales bacterium]|nr:hypothetical protein [Verrucomicrobiales bacterium]